jgi:hypothetical protein
MGERALLLWALEGTLSRRENGPGIRLDARRSRAMGEGRKDIHSAVRERIIGDPDFYDAVMSDPREALKEGLGLEIPVNVGIRVHRQTPQRLHIVLPFVLPAELRPDAPAGSPVDEE